MSSSKSFLLLLAIASSSLVVLAAPPSRFNRKIDERKLESDYAEDEDDEWHEDTFEWKKKMAQKNQKPLSMDDIQKGGNVRDKVLQHEASSGNMQMAFATIKESVTKDPKKIEEIGKRWQALLATDGVQVSLYPIGGQDLLFTEDNGRVLQVRDFVLNQPEAEKFRWKDTDFTPTPTPKAKKVSTGGKKKGPRVVKGADEL